MRIEIWSDVVCPWCYIGKRRFEKALTQLQAAGIYEPIEVVYRSYQLDPTAPTDRSEPVLDAYAKKFGGRERAEQILNHVTSVAAGDGVTFRMDIAVRANTILAHRLLHWVLTNHGATEQAQCKERLLAAYFSEGKNIGDLATVNSLVEELGYERDSFSTWLEGGGGLQEVHDDIEGARQRDITAVPSFVIDDAFIIPGAQDVQVFVQVLTKMLSR